MPAGEVGELIEDAKRSGVLRERLGQVRNAQDLAEFAQKEGYDLSLRGAKQIIAGAYLTSDRLTQSEKESMIAGITWNYLEKIERAASPDLEFLSDSATWERIEEFYEYVYEPDSD